MLFFTKFYIPKYANFFMSNLEFTAYYSIEVIMREVALAARTKNKEILSFLHINIQPKLNFCKNIITNYSDNNFAYLLFAFDEEFSSQVENIIRESIIEYIESCYKIEYLKQKIKNPVADNLTFETYIKVLSVFDKSTDKSAIEKIIFFNQTFFIDSFLEFRLLPLKKHWDNLAELSSDNLTAFSTETFIDIIRFLINTMENNIYKVKVICDDRHFKIYNMVNKNAKVNKVAECEDDLELISNILNSCPNYIDVYLNAKNENQAVSFLSNIFTNRLKIYSKS